MIPVVTSRVMEFTWLPPTPTMRNGRITGYNLTCFITGTGGMGRIGGIYTPSERYVLSGFRPARNYTCQVVAMNSVGSGPPAEATAQAPEDGKHILLVAILLILSISRDINHPHSACSGRTNPGNIIIMIFPFIKKL